mgnify:CR=1 FL=1
MSKLPLTKKLWHFPEDGILKNSKIAKSRVFFLHICPKFPLEWEPGHWEQWAKKNEDFYQASKKLQHFQKMFKFLLTNLRMACSGSSFNQSSNHKDTWILRNSLAFFIKISTFATTVFRKTSKNIILKHFRSLGMSVKNIHTSP